MRGKKDESDAVLRVAATKREAAQQTLKRKRKRDIDAVLAEKLKQKARRVEEGPKRSQVKKLQREEHEIVAAAANAIDPAQRPNQVAAAVQLLEDKEDGEQKVKIVLKGVSGNRFSTQLSIHDFDDEVWCLWCRQIQKQPGISFHQLLRDRTISQSSDAKVQGDVRDNPIAEHIKNLVLTPQSDDVHKTSMKLLIGYFHLYNNTNLVARIRYLFEEKWTVCKEAIESEDDVYFFCHFICLFFLIVPSGAREHRVKIEDDGDITVIYWNPQKASVKSAQSLKAGFSPNYTKDVPEENSDDIIENKYIKAYIYCVVLGGAAGLFFVNVVDPKGGFLTVDLITGEEGSKIPKWAIEFDKEVAVQYAAIEAAGASMMTRKP